MLYVNPMDARAGVLNAPTNAPKAREAQALQEYERLFVFQLLREMRKSVPESPLFGRSAQQDFMEEMMDDHLAGEIARSGQFGIAEEMRRQLEAGEARGAGAQLGKALLG